MRVIWNGSYGIFFSFERRGIWQGHPLSPYLFVQCMKRLGHLIVQPIKITKKAPPLSHIFFADDLVLIVETSSIQINVIKQCLKVFL